MQQGVAKVGLRSFRLIVTIIANTDSSTQTRANWTLRRGWKLHVALCKDIFFLAVTYKYCTVCEYFNIKLVQLFCKNLWWLQLFLHVSSEQYEHSWHENVSNSMRLYKPIANDLKSPDLNPTEHICQIFNKCIRKCCSHKFEDITAPSLLVIAKMAINTLLSDFKSPQILLAGLVFKIH